MSIGEHAFEGCSGLTSVIVEWETPLEIDRYVFARSIYNNAILYVPKGTKAAYEAASVWKDFGTIIECDRPQDDVETTDISALDNVIYMEPFEATKGKEVDVPLMMKNTAGIRGFQFDMQLPTGVTVAKNGNGRLVATLNNKRLPEGSAHTLTVNELEDGTVRFLCGSQYDETFTGSDGEIATLTINVSADMEEADYPVYLRHVKLTETDISKYYLTEEIETTAMVMNSPWLPGDATEDGDVNVTDIMAVANWILKIKMDKFNLLAADVNGDGDINVTDIMGIANIILKVTPSSNSRATSVADAVEPQ